MDQRERQRALDEILEAQDRVSIAQHWIGSDHPAHELLGRILDQLREAERLVSDG